MGWSRKKQEQRHEVEKHHLAGYSWNAGYVAAWCHAGGLLLSAVVIAIAAGLLVETKTVTTWQDGGLIGAALFAVAALTVVTYRMFRARRLRRSTP